MNRKKSKGETFKKISRVVGAIVGPVCAGFGWFAGLAPKTHRENKARQVMGKKRKEKPGMFENILKFLAGIVIVAGFGGGVYVLIQKAKEWLVDKAESTVNISEMSSQKEESKSVPTVSYQALFAKKRELEQRMASVTSGETGLFMLQELMRDSEGSPDVQYREAYRIKQDKLRGYMKDYRALLKQAEGAPEEERGRLRPVEGLERYQELLDEKV